MKRLLVIAPDVPTLDYLKERLDAPLLELHSVQGGEKAIEEIARGPFDVLVSTLEMARPNGLDVVSELRQRSLPTPAVLLSRTSEGGPRARVRAESLAPCRLLERPVVVGALHSAIEAFLGFKIPWADGRGATRVPIQLGVKFSIRGLKGAPIPAAGTAVDLSITGMGLKRQMCAVCPGYEKGDVHSDCVLFPNSPKHPASSLMEFTLDVPGREPLVVRGRIVYTMIEEGSNREMLGVRFADLTPKARDRVRELIGRTQRVQRAGGGAPRR